MAYVFYNPNPQNNLVGDCVIRAISKITNKDWEDVYIDIALQGFIMHDMPSSNNVWGNYLHDIGYRRYIIPDRCPNCYTVGDFTNDHPTGSYLLATGTHVIAVQDGHYFDTWNSGNEIPIYYWKKEEKL